MSAMGHRVRVLPFSTFRLNLSVTSPYNADFDGDEMNMFVPQGYESMAEVKEIMAVPLQIISPQSNKPVMGIVQDSLLGIMLLTRRDNFIDKPTAMNLMMWLGADTDRVLPPPAIIKPKPFWTGKQILSLVIPNVNMIRFLESHGKSPSSQWISPADTTVIINRGELISGYVNKQTAGSSQQGLIHIIYRECGPNAAKDFLSKAQLIVNQWLIIHGFTVGIQDAIASKQTLTNISDRLKFYHDKVIKIIDKAEKGNLKFQPGKNLMESFEAKVNNQLNLARDEAGQLAFKNLDPQNKIQNMVGAGSKGTNINISQILGCVGQQNVEGKRIPFGFKNRSLPHFTKYDFGPESKGFVKSNYLLGLEASEFFFHAMGGREGLIDTAVKTSETGYIQRRLVKALEDVMVKYDGTVRNSQEQVIQFIYGEDGMAAEYIEDVKIDLIKMSDAEIDHKFEFIPAKQSSAQRREFLKKSLDDYVVEELLENASYEMQLMNELKQIKRDRDELRLVIFKNGEDQIHVPVNIPRLIMNCEKEFGLKKHQPTKLSPIYVVDQVNKLIRDLTVYPGRTTAKSNTSFFYEANDNSTILFKIYLRSELSSKRIVQQERMTQDSFDWLIGEIKSRFEQSLVHPGETVGSIAAHSLGEPATQMTLNTFHFAGVSSKNVTLGVPRLKEVINVSKKILTPMVSIYLAGNKKKSERSVMKLQGDIEHSTFADIIDSSQIFYDPDPLKTVVRDDERLVALYNEVPEFSGERGNENTSPWLLRMKLDQKKVISRTLDMNYINKRLIDTFQDQVSIMHSDSNDENLVLRLRFKDVKDEPLPQDGRRSREDYDDTDSAVQFLKEIEDSLLNEFTLKGIQEITKVYAKKYNETEYDMKTGATIITSDNWMLETDGVALQKILSVNRVDHTKTISNDILELLSVLGVEAVRMSLINELRVVLNFYGIYVNYRHIATLCDVMCQKGRLTAITRHGINRLDSGPLKKCSFEETVEIFMEAAAYNESDYITGITESIMLGQTAPFGTGSFDLAIDPEVLQEYAQTSIEEEIMAGNTPIQDDIYENRLQYMTEYAQKTPDYITRGQTSEYGRTPGGQSEYQGPSFSPAYNCQSPAYASPNAYQNSPQSPQYKCSPVYGGGGIYGQRYQSPIYQTFTSPIYQPGSEGIVTPTGKQSPAAGGLSAIGGHSGIPQSPTYSPHQPSSLVNSPYHPDSQRVSYSPSYIGVGSKAGTNSRNINSVASSPSLVGNSPVSPSYSPPPASAMMGSHHRSSMNSPAYSPTVARIGHYSGDSHGQSHTSPHYSPTNYNPLGLTSIPGVQYQVKQSYSPSYSPTTSALQTNQSPKYNTGSRISPKYSVSAGGSSDPHSNERSIGTPRSGLAGSSQHEAGGGSSYSGVDNRASSLYIPSSHPRYNPNSPAYNPRPDSVSSEPNRNPYDPTQQIMGTSGLNTSIGCTAELISPLLKNEQLDSPGNDKKDT